MIHAKILYYTALYLHGRGRYNVARERCQCALDIRLDLLGGDHTEVADCLLKLAIIMHDLDEIEESEAMCRRALDIFERAPGKDNMWLLYSRNDLAIILLGTNDDRKLEEATEILRSVLAHIEQTLGLEHAWTIATTHNLAAAFLKQHKYSDSEELYRKILETRLRVSGEDNPGTINSMQNLAETLYEQEKYEEAQELSQRALDLSTRVLGEDHPGTLRRMRKLSRDFLHRRKTREAEELCRYALALHKAVFGENSHGTMDCTCILAMGLLKQQEYGQAEELFREVYKWWPKQWSDKSLNLFLKDFAETLTEVGKHDEAAEIRRRKASSIQKTQVPIIQRRVHQRTSGTILGQAALVLPEPHLEIP